MRKGLHDVRISGPIREQIQHDHSAKVPGLGEADATSDRRIVDRLVGRRGIQTNERAKLFRPTGNVREPTPKRITPTPTIGKNRPLFVKNHVHLNLTLPPVPLCFNS